MCSLLYNLYLINVFWKLNIITKMEHKEPYSWKNILFFVLNFLVILILEIVIFLAKVTIWECRSRRTNKLSENFWRATKLRIKPKGLHLDGRTDTVKLIGWKSYTDMHLIRRILTCFFKLNYWRQEHFCTYYKWKTIFFISYSLSIF